MVFLRRCALWMFMTPAIVLLAGCGGEQPADPLQEEPSSDNNGGHDHDHGSHDHGGSGESDIAEAMAALSPADRELAEQQRICLVTDDLLGSMGTPIKVQVRGHTVFICCEGCRDPLVDDPDEYLPKIGL